jgi:hypothetical protein
LRQFLVRKGGTRTFGDTEEVDSVLGAGLVEVAVLLEGFLEVIEVPVDVEH